MFKTQLIQSFVRLGFIIGLLSGASTANAAMSVFACEPEWKALAEALGGDKVKVYSATTVFQDPHHIEARPSLIVKMRNTDLVVCTGAGLEDAWLKLLVRQSGNKALSRQPERVFLAANFVEKLEVPKVLDRSLGDIHAEGNPHIHLDPHRLLQVAKALSSALSRYDVKHDAFYQSQLNQFTDNWLKAIERWELKAQVLKGSKAVVYHRNWSYLIEWLGIEEVADLEPIPGIPPSAGHLASVLESVQNKSIDFILLAPYQNDKGGRWLAKKGNIPMLVLPFSVGANKQVSDLEKLFDHTIELMLEVLVKGNNDQPKKV